MNNHKVNDSIRVHITMPRSVRDLFDAYSAGYYLSLSSFLVKSGLEKIRKHRGHWADKVTRLEQGEEEIPRDEFFSMSHDELWKRYSDE